MASAKKKTAKTVKPTKKTELKVSAPKKSVRTRKTAEESFSEVDSSENLPKTRIITKKYLYTLLVILAVIGVFFTLSRFWIVAWVDNKPITKFELYALLEKRDQGKTSEDLIIEKLLLSEGRKQKQSISDAEAQTEIQKIELQQGGAQQLDQILTAQGLSREDFNKLVELQLLKQKLFGGGVNITDEDVAKYIEENKDSIPPDMLANPESSEAAKLKDSVREQLKQLKVQENFSKWLEENLKGSRVVKN